MNLRLLRDDLHFVSSGERDKIHAKDDRYPTITMCGRPISVEQATTDVRSVDVERLCKRCCASLRTYTRGRVQGVRIEREVGA